MTTCSSCGAPNPPEQKFCGDCGTSLGTACASCGMQAPPGQKFCGECGAPLAAESVPTVATSTPVRGAPAAERRLVSVLFADLVGFTRHRMRRRHVSSFHAISRAAAG